MALSRRGLAAWTCSVIALCGTVTSGATANAEDARGRPAEVAGASGGQSTQFAKIWGRSGELWRVDQPLRDFSFAGYRQSEVAPPDNLPTINVRDFGAVGDGRADDTQALRRAIDACPPGKKVLLPGGRYVITDAIRIEKSIVIGGDRTSPTTLAFPKYLVDLSPRPAKTGTGLPTSLWSWSGGFIEFREVHEAGIEDLRFEFPEMRYAGHFHEKGSNGINFLRVRDGWARRLSFVNADSGIFVERSRNITLRDIEFDASPSREEDAPTGNSGHHAIDFVRGSYDCLADRIHFNTKFYHELGVEHASNGNVFSRCKGPNMVLDHHQLNVHGNLWTDIDIGKGDYAWINNARGSTNDEVYWNIRSQKPLVYPNPKLKNIVIGMTGTGDEVLNPAGPWVEVIDVAKLAPANLFQAQLERRLGSDKARQVLGSRD